MLTGVVFDALDPALMERFWSGATLGRTDGLRLRFEATDEPKTSKNRLHLCLAGGTDWPAEVERLLALGATRVDIGQGDVPWDVLADPEGNEFCVLRAGSSSSRTDAGLENVCLDMAAEIRDVHAAFWRSKTGWTHFEEYDWGVRLRRSSDSPVALTMGPPVTPKTGRNRLRMEIAGPNSEVGEFLDPSGNEYCVVPAQSVEP